MGAVADIEIGVRDIRTVRKVTEPATDSRCFCIRWFSSDNNADSAVEAR